MSQTFGDLGQGQSDTGYVVDGHGGRLTLLISHRFPTVPPAGLDWTQRQNLFAIELFGTRGAIVVEGLAGSYGRQRWSTYLRRDGGAPRRTRRCYGDDALTTLRREREDLVTAFDRPAASRSAWQRQAIDATAVIDDLYRGVIGSERPRRSDP
jgi:predicted dehydrogenase